MSLTGKDIVTTLLAVATFGLYYAMGRGIDLPVITGVRGAVLVMGAIGIMMCAMSGYTPTQTSGSNPFIVVASALGIASLFLIAYGLITGAKMALLLLTVAILALWVVSTFRHIITPSG